MKTERMYFGFRLIRWFVFGAATLPIAAAMSVTFDSSVQSPAPVGTVVTWSASADGANPDNLWYRFRVRGPGLDFRMVRDFGPVAALNWDGGASEGVHEIEVSVRDRESGETVTTSVLFELTSVVDREPAINPTINPLVYLYSAPACPSGARMRVRFQAPEGPAVLTPSKPCVDGLSMNFYLAGMRGGVRYAANHVVESDSGVLNGPAIEVVTPEVRLESPTYSVDRPQPPGSGGILLQSTLFQTPVATDLAGNLVWFYPDMLSFLTRPREGGTFFGIVQEFSGDTSRQIVREFDVAGMTVRETNAARINEQLVAMGKYPIGSFHHEARGLPDGKVLVLASTERILTDVQAPGEVAVIGDTILVLDQDLQVVWAWDSFDHMDPHRVAVINETCTQQGGGCPPLFLADKANDWLHGNSLALTPDGNILFSMRHQDWLVKIDYNNGSGGGSVLWRLGKDGDFRINSSDPSPWFSHQHDAQFDPANDSTLMVFDNGNVRHAGDSAANSRGQVLRLDEQNRVATLILNADLGEYSFALGSAQKLPNGNYHFDLGILPDVTSRSVEVDPSGKIIYAIHASIPEYRSFRMIDLYTP